MATVNGRAVLQETFFKAYVEDNELMTEWMIVEEGGGGYTWALEHSGTYKWSIASFSRE